MLLSNHIIWCFCQWFSVKGNEVVPIDHGKLFTGKPNSLRISLDTLVMCGRFFV